MTQDPHSTCDLSILIVSWNVWELLRACLRSIEAVSQPHDAFNLSLRRFGPVDQISTLEVIVVDNASRDATCEQLSLAFPWVRLIRSEENLGFTKGNNLGYQQSRGDFIFFLNPDTEIIPSSATTDSLWQLYSAVRTDPTIGMAGPQLRYADGSWQNNRRHFPTPISGFFESTWLEQAWPRNPWARHLHMEDTPATLRHEVDWITGAAMMTRRQAVVEARTEDGGRRAESTPLANFAFDEGFFMYSEELDLCKRIREAGWRIVYVPEALLIHYEGKSSEQVVAARHIHFNTSKVRYWQKWFGRRWAAVLRRYLLLEYRWQWLSEWVKFGLGHKRELRQARMKAYQEVLRSRLRVVE